MTPIFERHGDIIVDGSSSNNIEKVIKASLAQRPTLNFFGVSTCDFCFFFVSWRKSFIFHFDWSFPAKYCNVIKIEVALRVVETCWTCWHQSTFLNFTDNLPVPS